MINDAANQEEALKPYSKQPTFYTGKVRNSPASTYAYCYIDGVPDEYVFCVKTSALSVSINQRVVIMEIGGTYIVLARIT